MARAPTGCSTGLPVENCIVRALADIGKTTHVVSSISYSSSRARGFSLYLAMQTQQKPRRGGRPRGFHLDCALAQRVKSLFRRAGDRQTVFDCARAARAALTPGRRAHRAFYWPAGRENPSLSARLGDSCYFARCKIVESLLRRGARDFSLHFATETQQKPLWGRSARESWSWLGNKLRRPCAGGGPTKAKRTPAKHPTGAPGGRCLPARGTGHSGEKTVTGRTSHPTAPRPCSGSP